MNEKKKAAGILLLIVGALVVIVGLLMWRIQTRPCRECYHGPHVGTPCVEYGPGGLQCGCRRDR